MAFSLGTALFATFGSCSCCLSVVIGVSFPFTFRSNPRSVPASSIHLGFFIFNGLSGQELSFGGRASTAVDWTGDGGGLW